MLRVGNCNLRRPIILILIFIVALLARYWHYVGRKIDYYGDSYHHWLISYLTASNGYAYMDFRSDLNSMTVVWLPLYHYISAFIMNTAGYYYIEPLHAINVVLGAGTCALLTAYTFRLTDSVVFSASAGLALALQPWFIDINTLALTETVAAFLLMLAILAYEEGRWTLFLASILLGALTRYDIWFFVAAFFVLAWRRRGRRRRAPLLAVSFILLVSAWSTWSFLRTGDFLAWYRLESSMTGWDVRYFYKDYAPSLQRLSTVFLIALNATGYLFPVGIVAGSWLLLNRKNTVPASLYLFYVFVLFTQVLFGGSLPEPKYLVYVFPFTILMLVLALRLFEPILVKKRQILLAASLLLIIILPLRELWVGFPRTPPIGIFAWKTYIVEPEWWAGYWLYDNYNGGTVISDSPTVIYYSHPNVPVSKYISSDHLSWYSQDPKWSKEALTLWLKANNVRYLVWQNTSYSQVWWLFRELSDGKSHEIGNTYYQLAYDGIKIYRDRTVTIYIYRIIN